MKRHSVYLGGAVDHVWPVRFHAFLRRDLRGVRGRAVNPDRTAAASLECRPDDSGAGGPQSGAGGRQRTAIAHAALGTGPVVGQGSFSRVTDDQRASGDRTREAVDRKSTRLNSSHVAISY